MAQHGGQHLRISRNGLRGRWRVHSSLSTPNITYDRLSTKVGHLYYYPLAGREAEQFRPY